MDDFKLQTQVVASLFRGAAAAASLVHVDPRAWRTDGFRAARLAQAVLEQMPVAASVFVAREGAFEVASSFATSPAFVSVVEQRAELLSSFSSHVFRSGAAAGLEGLFALDGALVDLGEHGNSPEIGRQCFRVAPTCSILKLPVGIAEWHSVQFARLQLADGASLWERILSTAGERYTVPLAENRETESVLVVRGGRGRSGSVETLSNEMSALLRVLAEPVTIAQVVEAFAGELTNVDCEEILQGLVGDGLVIRGSEGPP